MYDDERPSGRRRWATIGTVALAGTALVAAGAYWLGTTTGNGNTPDSAQPTTPAPGPAPAPTPSHVDGATSPEGAAVAWFTTSHTLSWTDPTPAAWADRAAPYMTGPAADTAAAARTGGSGTDWQQINRGHCAQSVQHPDAVRPPEAPSTGDIVYIQISGSVVQQCPKGGAQPPWDLSNTVETRRGPDGTWRVSDQLQ